MPSIPPILWLLAFCVLGVVPAFHGHVEGDETPINESAAVRGLEIVKAAASRYPAHRKCFACHHQTLPMLAMIALRDKRDQGDEDWLQEQAKFTLDSFADRAGLMSEGKGVGGASLTVGYGLWALDLAGRRPDETTTAMVTFLLKNQKKEGYWERTTSRPPLEDSNFTTTFLAAVGLKRYADDKHKERAEAAVARAKKWLVETTPKSQEDRVFKLWGLHRLECEPRQVADARLKVLAAQREDGGWGQLDDMTSDAYATGQTLYVLHATGLSATDAVFDRGLQFLLKTQHADGSWKVETRSKPIQVYFDNGDPHDKHQFISTPATAWAVAALAAANKR